MVGGGHPGSIGRSHRAAALLDGRWDLVAGAFSRNPEVGRAERAIAFMFAALESSRDEGRFAEIARLPDENVEAGLSGPVPLAGATRPLTCN
jgi:hypothetical protein